MPRRLLLPGLLAGLAAGMARPAAAQGLIGISAGQGQVGVSAEGFSTAVEGAAAARSGDFREWIQLPLSGAVVDRRVFSWAATLQPTLQQRVQTGFDRTLAARQLNLSFLGRVLADRPLRLTLSAARGNAVSSGGFGTRREATSTQLGGDIAWRNRYLPMHLAAFRREADETWRNTSTSPRFRTDQRVSSVRFSASNSKLALEASRFRFEDRVTGLDLDAWTLGGRHTFRWGKGSSLATSLESQREDGSYQTRRSHWSEQLRLQHTRQVGTTWFYRRGVNRVDAVRSVGEGYGGGFDLRPARWLSLGFDAARNTGTTGDTRETFSTLTPRAGVNLALPARGRLTASASVGREFRRREGPLPQGVPVVDERHTVPVARQFTLDELDVVPGSVVVRDAGGATVYVDGVDYTLITVGRFTTVDVPPAGRIQVGDQLRISYRHLPVATRATGDAWRTEYEATLQIRFLTVRHQRSLRELGGGAVSSGLLPTGSAFDDRRTAATLRAATGVGRFDLEGALRQTDRFGQQATEHSVSAGYAPPALGATTVSLTAAWNRLETGPTVVRAVSALVALGTAPTRWLRVQAGFEGYDWRQTGLAPQQFASARLGADATLGLMEIGLTAEAHRRAFVVTNQIRRVTLRVLRRF